MKDNKKTNYTQALIFCIYKCNTAKLTKDSQIDYIERTFNAINHFNGINCDVLHSRLIKKLRNNEQR